MTKPKPKELHKKRGRKPKNPAPGPEIRDLPAQVKTGKRMGRPYKLNPDTVTLEKVKLLAQLQCTEVEAASYLKVDDETFKDFLAREPDAAATWSEGRAEGIVKLRNAQFRKALSGNPEMLKWLGRQVLGQSDKTVVEQTGKDGGPIQTATTVVLTEADKKAILDILE